jgi:hypothetical protein
VSSVQNALGWIGPETIDALPDIEHKTAAPLFMLQLAACSAIARISGDPSKALPVLLSTLEGPDPVLHKQLSVRLPTWRYLRSVLGARMVKNRGWQQLLEWR